MRGRPVAALLLLLSWFLPATAPVPGPAGTAARGWPQQVAAVQAAAWRAHENPGPGLGRQPLRDATIKAAHGVPGLVGPAVLASRPSHQGAAWAVTVSRPAPRDPATRHTLATPARAPPSTRF
ncbi:hypothetical protein [Nonomuraea jiangxiensis]|uniref:Uncharacterized protein n=1 Tax=Nonomuraea jiangxiensis TaxID=633440 RepID=A0A1G8EPR4_9ACTN|nr:hypothetical protein [Nonomuraea jiangxiensis]SDH71886.1 hypothetical protein SAMN05421869_10362 [Nonomuraea jiangxiensis]